ncbi:MAG: MBL fold metallo-hydrolase [Gammaproteobacteria bacterium]|nr:MBL fold metallo-hydrolase [Gammaproteobacteria bacterium]
MRFAALGSGSRGNGWLVAHDATRLLVDCGFSLADTTRRLARLGLAPGQLDGVLLTHEHADHASGVGPLARRHGIPVWMTHGTRQALRDADLPDLRLFDTESPFAVGALEVAPFAVPHDAREPSQFVIGDGARRLGLVTDLGCTTPHVERSLAGCDALVLEANHDRGMLSRGSYPPALKRRISGRHGHLCNEDAAGLLERLDTGRLQHFVAAHLSAENNRVERVRELFSGVLGCAPAEIEVADQAAGIGWRELA